MKSLCIFCCLGALAMAVAAQAISRSVKSPKHRVQLAAVLPADLSGWVSKPGKLGTTEALSGAVEQVLQFDDVYFREFQSVRGRVSLYVAYWGQAKMPTQVVASHNPDRCWTSAGWICDEKQHAVSLGSRSSALREGERRIFRTHEGEKLHVQFWLLVGGETYDFGDNFGRIPSAWRWWRDAARQMVTSPREQLFIRLGSERPFAELAGDPGWEALLASLGRLGLAPPARTDSISRSPGE